MLGIVVAKAPEPESKKIEAAAGPFIHIHRMTRYYTHFICMAFSAVASTSTSTNTSVSEEAKSAKKKKKGKEMQSDKTETQATQEVAPTVPEPPPSAIDTKQMELM